MKIIIIGSGIAGLVLAIACQRAGMQVRLYEKTKQLENIGGGILLWPHGVRYLEWLGLADHFKSYLPLVKSCRVHNARGHRIINEDYAALYSRLGGKIFPIERSLLQKILLQQLPHSILSLNKKCIGLKDESNEVKVFFSDGSHDSADIVIGADGIHSTIRKHLTQQDVIQYADYCWWGGIIEQKNLPAFSSEQVLFAIHYGKICNIWPLHSERYMWFIPAKINYDSFVKEEPGFKQLKSLCHDWDDAIVQQLIDVAAQNQHFHVPIYTVSPQPNWGGKRVTMIGDAAHALGPLLGQGTNLAIEDAFILFNLLKNNPQDIPKLIRQYELLRYAKIKSLSELENKSAATLINEDKITIDLFQQELKKTSLIEMFKEIIPLIDEKACQEIANAF